MTLLAADLGVPYEVTGGVLRVPIEAAARLFDGAMAVLAPLEAALVHVVRADVANGSPASLIAVACASPTLAQLTARRRHRGLLDAIQSRAGVTVGFQRVADLSSGQTVGFEAFLRVRAGHRDASPGEVLAAAEDAGRLVDVDAVARSAAAREAAPSIGDRILFLNVLPASLAIPAEQLAPFATEVDELGLDRGRIVLEAPLGPAGALRRQVDAVLRAAREVGFLTGLDNVRSERDLHAVDVVPDYVKLDRSVVRGLPSPAGTRTLGALVRDCQQSGATLVAQGIESQEQLRAAVELGVRLGQGWALGRPGPISAGVDASTT